MSDVTCPGCGEPAKVERDGPNTLWSCEACDTGGWVLPYVHPEPSEACRDHWAVALPPARTELVVEDAHGHPLRLDTARRVYVCWSPIWTPGILKIGVTGNVHKRMKALRAEPLLVLVGGRELETMIHRKCAPSHVQDEHFRVSRYMLWCLSYLREQQRDAGYGPYDAGDLSAFLARIGVSLRRQYPWQADLWADEGAGRDDRVARAIRAELDAASALVPA